MSEPADEIPPLALPTFEVAPVQPYMVNFDVNEYLQNHSEEELWRFLGALKDFFAPPPKDLQA